MLRNVWESGPARWGLALAWMGFIFYLSSLPSIPYLGGGWYTDLRDIAGHFTVYAVLALLWKRALAHAGVERATRWAFIVAVVYGVSDEFHQSFVPGRTPDIFDIVTDAAGAAFGLWLMAKVQLWRRQTRLPDSRAA
jgi:VanZ family protein